MRWGGKGNLGCLLIASPGLGTSLHSGEVFPPLSLLVCLTPDQNDCLAGLYWPSCLSAGQFMKPFPIHGLVSPHTTSLPGM